MREIPSEAGPASPSTDRVASTKQQVDIADRGHAFAAEEHLRDYFAEHLDLLEKGLRLYVGDDDTTGIEYITPIGRIDLLAQHASEGFVVIELKVSKGADSVCGQLMRYVGWVKRHLADGKPVRGFIIAQHISDKIRYAVADLPHVFLKEYDIALTLRDAGGSGRNCDEAGDAVEAHRIHREGSMTALVSSKFAVVLRSDARSQPDVPTTAESNRTAWRSPPLISVSKPTATIFGVRHSADAGIVVKSRTIPAHHAKAFVAFESISVMIAAEVKNQSLVGVR